MICLYCRKEFHSKKELGGICDECLQYSGAETQKVMEEEQAFMNPNLHMSLGHQIRLKIHMLDTDIINGELYGTFDDVALEQMKLSRQRLAQLLSTV